MSSESIKDPLTGIYNYEYFQSRMREEIQRSNRNAKPYSVVRFDIDHFKQINENYGFDFGNIILKQFSELLGNTTRATDLNARQEAEQFLVMLPEVSMEDAFSFAERVRKRVEESEDFGTTKDKIRITVSSGIVSYVRKEEMEVPQMLQLLDTAVYQAKDDGRNCIIPYTMFLPQDNDFL